MTEAILFKAEIKQNNGKGVSRALRRDGRLPSIIYGGDNQIMVSLSLKEFLKEYNKGGIQSKIVNIDLGDTKVKTITKDIQFHPVSDVPLHVDFREVSDNTLVRIAIPLKIINEEKSPGIKKGGVLNTVHRSILFLCHPDYIASHIEVDISHLEIGQSIHINDLNINDKLVPLDKSNFIILSISGRSDDEESKQKSENKE